MGPTSMPYLVKYWINSSSFRSLILISPTMKLFSSVSSLGAALADFSEAALEDLEVFFLRLFRGRSSSSLENSPAFKSMGATYSSYNSNNSSFLAESQQKRKRRQMRQCSVTRYFLQKCTRKLPVLPKQPKIEQYFLFRLD